MWCTKKTSLTSSESMHLWRDMACVPVEAVASAWHATDDLVQEENQTSLVFDQTHEQKNEGYFSDTAFACIHNPQNPSTKKWALVRLDNLSFAGDTAYVQLFESKSEILKFIANRYFHRMLFPRAVFAVE